MSITSRRWALRTLLIGVVACTTLAYYGCGGGSGSSGSGGSGGSGGSSGLYSSVAVADLNGDGKPDIVTCFSTVAGPPPHPGFVAVYLQDPASPGTFLPAVTYSVGNDPVSVAIGDLNGDGKPDIVTANTITATSGAGSSNVSVLLQDPTGTGHFLPATNYATGQAPTSVAIGDLNGDGRPDLAVADLSGISVLFQNPSVPGSFLPRITLSVGSPTASAAIGDLNGDGKPDLVAAAADSGPGRPTIASAVVLLQNPTMPGTFSAPTSYGAGLQPIWVAIADLNGDGKADLALANLGSPEDGRTASVSVLLQDPAVPGRFLAATNYSTDIRSSVVAIADLNGDGKPDLAVANTGALAGGCPPNCSTSGSVSVLLQDPTLPGRFQAATNYTANRQVLSVAIGDMNGDNKPDLVIANDDGIVIRFQDPANPGAFLAPTVITK